MRLPSEEWEMGLCSAELLQKASPMTCWASSSSLWSVCPVAAAPAVFLVRSVILGEAFRCWWLFETGTYGEHSTGQAAPGQWGGIPREKSMFLQNASGKVDSVCPELTGFWVQRICRSPNGVGQSWKAPFPEVPELSFCPNSRFDLLAAMTRHQAS